MSQQIKDNMSDDGNKNHNVSLTEPIHPPNASMSDKEQDNMDHAENRIDDSLPNTTELPHSPSLASSLGTDVASSEVSV